MPGEDGVREAHDGRRTYVVTAAQQRAASAHWYAQVARTGVLPGA
ncbi:hypothetical protein [Streptomyces cinereospinus]|uniref:Uncharacterized protein n=1 Tax=Streptomyces cinereospinus TaxID=285561 RepID=A0ABV5NBI1_9ACTN